MPGARGLALLLLVLIGYGAVIETVHEHGKRLISAAIVARPTYAGEAVSSYILRRDEDGCSICQLHQNIYNGLIQLDETASAVETSQAPEANPPSFYSGQSGVPRLGRAPPILQ